MVVIAPSWKELLPLPPPCRLVASGTETVCLKLHGVAKKTVPPHTVGRLALIASRTASSQYMAEAGASFRGDAGFRK